jgi:hypothetical protein
MPLVMVARPAAWGIPNRAELAEKFRWNPTKEKRDREVPYSNLDSLRSFRKRDSILSKYRTKSPVFSMQRVAPSCARGEFREKRDLIAKMIYTLFRATQSKTKNQPCVICARAKRK